MAGLIKQHEPEEHNAPQEAGPIYLHLTAERNEKQWAFWTAKARHIAYGGSRGGGKSFAMRRKFIGLALKYPELNLLLLRRTRPELYENHVRPLLVETSGVAKYREQENAFTFPNGSRIKLGYCEAENDVYQYQGQEYDVIGFEEATHFTETQKDFLLTCNRSTRKDFSPRAYYTANPGNVGHAWFKRLFITRNYRQSERPEDYVFIRARIYDNSVLMRANPQYVRDLENLPTAKRKAFLDGDWDAMEGQVFDEWNEEIHVCKPFEIPKWWRRWGGNDPGFRDPACWYWLTADQDSNVFVYREACFSGVAYSEQAREVARLTGTEQIDFWVAGMDAFNKNPQDGKSFIDYFREGGLDGLFKRPVHGPGCRAKMAGTFHEYLRPVKGPDGKTTARLRIFQNCTRLIERIPSLIADAHDPECVADRGDDEYQALGYALQIWHADHSCEPAPELQYAPGSLPDILDHKGFLESLTRRDDDD